MAQFAKKPLYTRVGRQLGRMLGAKMLKPGILLMASIAETILQKNRASTVSALRSFEDMQTYYDLSDQDIEQQYLGYCRQTAAFILFLCLFIGYHAYELYFLHQPYSIHATLALFAFLVLALRSAYFAYLLKHRRLDIGLLQWMLSPLIRRKWQ